MKICFLIYNNSRAGGSERVTSLIANGLSNKGHEVHILNICGKNKSFYKLNKNIKMETIYKDKDKINHKAKYFNIVKKIYKYYKNNKIDISIEIFASLSLYIFPIKKKLKIKNITWEHFNFFSNEGMNKIARKLACKFSNEIVTLTKEDMYAYKNNIKNIRAKLDYIYNPTPFENPEKSKLNSSIVLTVGRLTYQKGYDILLDVWKKVEEKNNKLELQIVGDGEDKSKLQEKAKSLKLKKVVFVGVTSEIHKYYKNALMYVSTSRFEGLPMCMIEAQTFGLPIISFEYKNGPREIIQDGKTGFIIKDYNIGEMAKKIIELAKDKQRIKEFSDNISIENFKLEEIIEKWQKTIEKL